MATTSIWDVKDNLKRVIDYTINPNKTEKLEDSDYQYNGLGQVISYTTQDLKTEKQLYVTGINCSMSTAYDEMMITKKAFNKTDGILAFHCYQSFKPDEVDAEVAHQIGIELAQLMWGDRFEVVVSTHLDQKHYHNHFVINSVSFKDGLKYYDNKENYKKLRNLSDELCYKYHFSVIKYPKKKSQHYGEWYAEQHNKPTLRSMVREDVDYAINQSRSMKEFYKYMEVMEYEIKFGKHIAVRPKGKERFIRLKSLSDDGLYTEDEIRKRIYHKISIQNLFSTKKEMPKQYHYNGNIKKAKKLTGFRAMYFCYMYRMGILPKNALSKKRVHFLLKEELKYMDQITDECTLLCKKKINTLVELINYQDRTKQRLDSLIKQRRCFYNKIKRCRNSDTKEMLEKDVSILSDEITKLRKEVRLYEGIKIRSTKMKKNLVIVIESERKEREESDKWRNSRSSR